MDTINKHSELIVEVYTEAVAAIAALGAMDADDNKAEMEAVARVLSATTPPPALAENDELKNFPPTAAGGGAWEGAFAVVVPMPLGIPEVRTFQHLLALEQVLKHFLPNCAAVKHTQGWYGHAQFFRAYAPPELHAGPALILLSGKGMALWEMHQLVGHRRFKNRKRPAPSAARDVCAELRRDARDALWKLFTDIDDDKLVPGGCDNVFCPHFNDKALIADIKLDIRQMPYARICDECYRDDLPFFLQGWDISLVAEYKRRGGGLRPPTPPQEADPAPVAKKVKIDA